jgi:hypothetical protein
MGKDHVFLNRFPKVFFGRTSFGLSTDRFIDLTNPHVWVAAVLIEKLLDMSLCGTQTVVRSVRLFCNFAQSVDQCFDPHPKSPVYQTGIG